MKKSKSFEEDSEEDGDLNIKIDNLELRQKYGIRNSDDNYMIRKNFSSRKPKFVPQKKIIVTDNSYILKTSNGKKSKITKIELDNIECLKKEKEKYDKKNEKKDDHLMRYLKVELYRAQKLKKVKEKLNEKDEKLKKFINVKNKGIKQMENGRYQDRQGIHDRQKIVEKMISNYEQKVYLSKQQQKELNESSDLKKISMEKSKKLEELSKQIQDYERKNVEYKQKISDIFELKEKEEIEKLIKERLEKKENNENPGPKIEKSSVLMKKKLNDLEEKFEIEKYRRENALLNNMSKYQNKINNLLEQKEEKEKKIKNALIKAEKEKEIERKKKTDHFNEVRENIKNNQIIKEEKRQKLLEDIEKKNLKNYAIKQEKLKMFEERRKINKQNKEEREVLKLKIQEIINKENNISEGEKNEEIINKLINDTNRLREDL